MVNKHLMRIEVHDLNLRKDDSVVSGPLSIGQLKNSLRLHQPIAVLDPPQTQRCQVPEGTSAGLRR